MIEPQVGLDIWCQYWVYPPPPEGKEVGKTVWIILKGLRHPNNFGIFNMNNDMQVPLDKEACKPASRIIGY